MPSERESNSAMVDYYEVNYLAEPLLQWYQENKREMPWRKEASPYHVWVSEIMLQQTRIEAVIGYYDRFLKQLPDVKALADAEEEQLLKLWEGLGYYNRVRNMQKAARIMVERYDGELPADYDLLLGLPGIGSYTAGAIASIAYKIPVPAVDGNVLRVVMRFLNCRDDIMRQSVRKKMERSLMRVIPEETPGQFNEALMELGEVICIPNGAPLCEKCPLQSVCKANQCDTAETLPVRTPAKERRIEKRTVFIFECDGKIGLRKRPDSGLLAGLWEFPSLETHYTIKDVKEMLKINGVQVKNIETPEKYKHIFSHIEWHMKGFRIQIGSTESIENIFMDMQWAERNELQKKYPIPTAFRGFCEK